MPVVGIARPIADGRAAEEGENGLKRFFRTYFVETDSALDGPDTVRKATGLPILGDPYPSHPSAVCVAILPEQIHGTRLHWRVRIEYSTHSVDRDENPLNTKPIIEYSYEPYDRVIAGTAKVGVDVTQPQGSSDDDGNPNNSSTGYFGFPILNAAGDPLQGFITDMDCLPVVRVTRNEASFSPQAAIIYGNTVNAQSWNGLLPRQAWLKPIEATAETQYASGIDKPDIRYWQVRYTFVLKAETWDQQFLNYGPNYITPVTDPETGEPIEDNRGNYVYTKKSFSSLSGHPMNGLLKKNGHRFGKNERQEPNWLRFRVKREIHFGPLGITLNLTLPNIRRIT